MRVRKFDKNGDIAFGHGKDDYAKYHPEAVALSVKTKLDLWRNTWFTDLSDGTPWLGDVLGKYPQAVYDSVIRKRILETQGVKSILEYESSFNENTRKISVQCAIDTIYGETTLEMAV